MLTSTINTGLSSKTERARRSPLRNATRTGADAIKNSIKLSRSLMETISKAQEESCSKDQSMVSEGGVQTRTTWKIQSTGL